MCFTIPYKIISVKNNCVIIEDGRTISLGKELQAKKGKYVQLIGNLAVGVLSEKQGESIRSLIMNLNKTI